MSDFLGMFGSARGVRGQHVPTSKGDRRSPRPPAVEVGEVGGD